MSQNAPARDVCDILRYNCLRVGYAARPSEGDIMQNVLWALWLACAAGPNAAQTDICRTTEVCATPGERTCVCSARSAGALNFYWRIHVARGHRYHCEMDSPVSGHVQVLPELCTTPPGASLSWDACCGFEPAAVTIDTHAMADPEGDAVIKFQVGPSDLPSRVHVVCNFEEES